MSNIVGTLPIYCKSDTYEKIIILTCIPFIFCKDH